MPNRPPPPLMNQRAITARSNRQGVERKAADEILALVFDNETGAEVGAGDVVIIDPSNERAVVFAAAKGDPAPVIVYMGGLDEASIRCVNSGVIVRIICDGDAITPGDLIVASATNKYGSKITAASLAGVLGTAVSSKAGAVVAEVQVLLSPSGFGYLSTVPTVINNWTRDAINSELYPAVLTDQIGLGISDPTTHLHMYDDDASTVPAFLIEQDGAGDAAVGHLLTGGQAWTYGIDNSVSDAFVIAGGANLQTNPFVTILITGEVGLGTPTPDELFHIESGKYVQRVDADVNEVFAIRDSGNTLRYRVDMVGGDATLQLRDATNVYAVVLRSNGISHFIGGNVGFGVIDPDATVEIFDTGTQLKLSYDATHFVTLAVDANHDTTITPSSTGQVIVKPTGNATDTFEVNQDDDTNVVRVDTVNRRLIVNSGTVGQSTIEAGLIVNNASGSGAINDFQVNTDSAIAILVDASADVMDIRVPTTIEDDISLFFGSDDDMYMEYVSASDRLDIMDVGNATGITMLADGSVGLGVVLPLATLDVVGTTRLGDSATNYVAVSATGDIVFVGSAGMPYGGISAVDNAVATAIAVAGTKVQIIIFDTDNPSNGVTPDHTNDHITIATAGDYLITVSATVNSIAGAASRFEMTVQKNNGAATVPPLHIDRNLAGGAGESGSVSMSGVATLAASDTIEVWIENETNTQNYVVENIALTVVQIGG